MNDWTAEQVLTESLKILDNGDRWVKDTMVASIYHPNTGVMKQGWCAIGAMNTIMEVHGLSYLRYSDPVRQARVILEDVAKEMGYPSVIALNDMNPHGFDEVRVMFEKAIANAQG